MDAARGIAYTAGWVWCRTGDLRRGAAVVVQDGRVREVVQRPPADCQVCDLGEGLLLPGLVNAHCHLELSFLAGAIPPRGDFVGWLEEMVALRPGHDRGQAARATAQAVEEAMASGTACLADITNTGRAQETASRAGLSVVSYFEALGQSRCEPPPAGLSWSGVVLTANGVAAHAPYSVPSGRLAELKRRAGALPFCIHALESRAEIEFFAGQGREGRRLEGFLEARGLLRASLDLTSSDPLRHLMGLGVLDGRTMLVHGVQLRPDQATALAASGASLCLCPRSNLGLAGGLAPLEALLAAGVNLALGSDSLASTPDLNLWSEMAALLEARPGLDPETVLGMATLGGARALGLEGHFGALTPGAAGPLAFAPLEPLPAGEVLAAAAGGRHAGPPQRLPSVA